MSLQSQICAPDQTLDRDLRLDACRGVALWFIFINHIPDNICSWLTLGHYGFSDTTEIFMFVSGVTCALAYGAIQRCDGWWAVVSHTLRRSWEIYAAFLTLVIGLVVLVYWAGVGRLADDANVRVSWSIRARRWRMRRSCNIAPSIPMFCRISCCFICCSRRCSGCC